MAHTRPATREQATRLNFAISHADTSAMALRSHWNRWLLISVVALLLFAGMGCATLFESDNTATIEGLDYFQRPLSDDVWSPKIEGWQRCERFDSELIAPLESGPAVQSAGFSAANSNLPTDQSAESGLRAKYFDFRAGRRRARWHKKSRPGSSPKRSNTIARMAPSIHWATLEETLARGGRRL